MSGRRYGYDIFRCYRPIRYLHVDKAVTRIANDREEGVNTFEKKESLQRVREIYLKLAEKFPNLFHVVDVNKSISLVEDEIKTFTIDFLSTK